MKCGECPASWEVSTAGYSQVWRICPRRYPFTELRRPEESCVLTASEARVVAARLSGAGKAFGEVADTLEHEEARP